MKKLSLALLCGAAWLTAAPSVKILPEKVELNGPEARQQLLAEATDGAYQDDLTRVAAWTSSNPAIVKVDAHGMLQPVADGTATIVAKSASGTATLPVRVKNAQAPFQWSFRNHVIPVLTKTGCNQGACHGALAGKNGFKLTLRGYDPEVDFDVLTRQSLGRRVSLAEPANSLVLLKASFGMPHGGGQRFKKDSLEYRVIQEWIAAGTPAPAAQDPELKSIEVLPAIATLQKGKEQQLIVRAQYSDGTTADVTRWVKYTTSNEGVAAVDDNGLIKMNGQGEAAISLWYNSRVMYARVTSPFDNQISEDVYKNFPRRNYLDDLALAKWKALRLAPSKQASDETFLRRAYLDAAGILPTAEEVEQYLADKSTDKREKMIDRLLARDEFTDYWAYKWSDLLLVSSRKLRTNSMWSFYHWIRESVAENKPWNQFATEILTSSGNTRQNGALNYFVMHKDPIDLTENVTQAFLGQRLTCARCHNHPLEKWTQKQYYQMANLFSRVGVKNGNEAGDSVVFAKASGDINHPRLLRPLAPTPLDGQGMGLDDQSDRRAHFAKWLTGPQNHMFSRSITNRIFGNFMGRGLVDPIDDVRATNPASNEEMFAALDNDFIKNGYDVKKLIRTIMNSSVYSISSEANATNQSDNIFYSKYIIKRLPAEVVLDTMSQVTGAPTSFDGYPVGTRALQLPDVQVKSQFLFVFGRPARVICDASERSVDPSIAQALHVINGDTLNKKLSAPDGYVSLLMKLGLSDSRMLEHLFLSAYSRYPTTTEKEELTTALAKSRVTTGSAEAQRDARRQSLEDMAWAMLASKEFLFNH